MQSFLETFISVTLWEDRHWGMTKKLCHRPFHLCCEDKYYQLHLTDEDTEAQREHESLVHGAFGIAKPGFECHTIKH